MGKGSRRNSRGRACRAAHGLVKEVTKAAKMEKRGANGGAALSRLEVTGAEISYEERKITAPGHETTV